MNLKYKIMEKEKFSNENSLKLISEMIETAKSNIIDNGFFLRLWGWLVICGSLGHYALLKFTDYEHPHIAWSLLIIGIIWSPIYGIKLAKKEKVKTHIDKLYTYTWFVFFINYVIILVFMAKLNYYVCPLILMIAAGSVFMNGLMIKFKPLFYSAIFIWIVAISCFYVKNEIQLLLAALACVGYLFPGYMLRAKYNKENV